MAMPTKKIAYPAARRTSSWISIMLPLPRPGGFGLGDLGEEYILRLLHNYARDGVAHAEVAEVQQRQHTADDEDHVARQANPFQEGVRLVGQELERAGLVVTDAHRLVELQDAQGEERSKAHPGEPDVERPEAPFRRPLRPALLRDQVTQTEEGQARGEHPVDAHHRRVAVVGGKRRAYLVVGDDR